MPKIDRMVCLHKTLHPNRFDGARTVCLDCETPVGVAVSGNGLSYDQSLERLGPHDDELVRLRSEVDRLQYEKDMLTMRNRQLEDDLSGALQGHDD